MISVLIAGIGGASLGVEIAKCLRLAGGYRIQGCDISLLAFGHYSGHCDRTLVVSRERYIDDVLDACRTFEVDVIVPGGDQPARLLAAASARIEEAGVKLAGNVAAVVDEMADKARCFERLATLGFRIPRTVLLQDLAHVATSPAPAVVKPSGESGGSSFVFFARNRQEVELYAAYLLNNGLMPIAQEYLPHESGEFTVGVLSNRNGEVEGAVVLKRSFHVKLSVMARGADFLISSGYSQGHIGSYPQIEETAVSIAKAIGSRGPINVQGRLDADGGFVPFEINPRFSASTYLRALAGFNEVDHHIRALCGFAPQAPLEIRPGWYMRGLSEVFVADSEIRQ
jgi:carbamoyl-phosphate synthase large subunit